MARADVPASVAHALSLGKLTALQKPNGRVRGIVAGDAFKRLVGKTLARQHGKAFEAACAPYQYALSTRAGTDCAGHLLRAATDADPLATIVSIDGVGAFDHARRAAMARKLASMPDVNGLLPYFMMSYG